MRSSGEGGWEEGLLRTLGLFAQIERKCCCASRCSSSRCWPPINVVLNLRRRYLRESRKLVMEMGDEGALGNTGRRW